MTEKEKAITGQLYNPNDKTLKEERNRCKEICHEYNRIKPLNMDERKRLIKSLF